MNPRTLVRRTGAATGLALALVASGLLGVSTPAQAAAPAAPTTIAPEPTHGATVDWFDDAYPALGADHVFETVTFERFEYLLRKNTGRWAFVVGGPEDDYLQQTIGHIDAVAKAQGIEKIYNFDPNLDGEALSVFDLTGFDLASADNAGKDQFLDLGQRLVTDYLGKDAETPFRLATDVTRPDQRVADGYPYLFVYDAAGGDSARIVDGLTTPPADLGTPAAVTTYRQDVARVLGSAELDVDTQWDFLSAEHNRRHFERYVKNADPATEAANRARFGGDIFNAADDLTDGDEEDFRIESITYPELLHILDSDGDFVLLFGGTWCHNTAAVIKQTAQYARDFGIKKVYNFDFSLDSTGNGGSLDKHIRDNAFRTVAGTSQKTRPSYLYGRILERLSNARTQYRTTTAETGTQSVSPVRYYDDGVVPDPANPATGEKLARKIQVGHLLSYDKDAQDAGQPAPVLDQAIRADWTNPEAGTTPAPEYAGNVEYMTEWWYTLGKDEPFDATAPDRLRGNNNVTAAAGQNALRNQRNFAKEAIRDVRDVIAGVAGGYDSSVTATGLPVSVPVGQQAEVDAEVTVESIFDGFYSDRTASATAAPLVGDVPLGGAVKLYVDETLVTQGDVAEDRTVSLTGSIPALTTGEHELRAVYEAADGGLVKDSEVTQPLTVVASSSTTTLADPAPLRYGTAGQVTATVTSGATGTATLTGLPGGAVVAPVQSGTATFAVPATVPAGTYSLSATYAGDETYASSTSAAKDLVVGKALTIVKAASGSVVYGRGGALKVSLTSPGGAAVTGPVTLSGVGPAQTRELSGGSATFTLPRTLAVAKYSAKIAYAGTANLNASQSQVSFTVSKAAPGRPSFKPKGKVSAARKGKATVAVPTAAGLAKAGGQVTVTLTKGKVTKVVRATLVRGVAQVSLPRLTKGAWKAVVSYAGDGTWTAVRSAAVRVSVKK
ncbi:Ig-like domain repeat protein [Nocardioides lijunqiniae]|uniref:Ig-like domain repeat protein n=1 Tax=Nocardioides lijunqiniae TaxID=2760832 RepID=UPI0018788280|nr:Ig-like domain repeat protein [Nocardioides lijunqiniae]